jgi:hypothetical protein
VTARRRRRRKQLLDELKEKRGSWQLKEVTLDRTLWRIHFGRGYGDIKIYITSMVKKNVQTSASGRVV